MRLTEVQQKILDGGEGEVITGISDGDEALFRYVKSDKPYTKATIKATGSGTVKVMLDDVVVGTAAVNGECTEIKLDDAGSGLRTLKLAFEKPEDLEIISICIE